MKVKIGDICEVVSGSTPNTNIAEYWDGDIDWITPAEITDDTYVIEKSIRKISRLGVEKAGLKSFPEGTVILSSRAPIGKVAIAGKEMYCNQGFKNLICSSAVLPEYLYWFLKGNSIYLNSLGRGATFKEISKGIVEGIEVSLPSTDEQQIIIEKIKKCWNILILRKSQLEKFDELTKARFVEMFGDIKRNSKNWRVVSFTECADIDTNMIHDFKGYEKYPHIGIDSIEKETGRLVGYRTIAEDGVISGKYLFSAKHIIYSKIRPNLNKVALPDFDGLCSADAYPILAKEGVCVREYLAYVLRNQYFLDYILAFSSRTNLPKVNKNQVEGFMLPLPTIDKQNQFASFVTQVDKSKVAVQKSLDEAQLLFDSLMQKYFG